MLGMNLHHIVRGAIQTVNPDTPGAVYVSTGHSTYMGITRPQFAAVPARLQVQAASHESLHHLDGLQSAKAISIIYAYGNFNTVNRPSGSGGDLVRVGDDWWAIQNVLEWWPGWCSFSVTQQLNEATLEALLDAIANGRVPGEPGAAP